MAEAFSAFLERSLRVLRAEAPTAYLMLAARIGPRGIALYVDGEGLSLQSSADRVCVGGPGRASTPELRTSRAGLRSLLNAETALLDAIISERFDLRGPVDELVRMDDCLQLYLRGTVRCPSFPELLRQFMEPAPKLQHRLLTSGVNE